MITFVLNLVAYLLGAFLLVTMIRTAITRPEPQSGDDYTTTENVRHVFRACGRLAAITVGAVLGIVAAHPNLIGGWLS